MRKVLVVNVFAFALFLAPGCGDHDPVAPVDPELPDKKPEFGNENFFNSGYFHYRDGVQTPILQSNRVISVIFDSTASNSSLIQVAEKFKLLKYPDLTEPKDADWDAIKIKTSNWVIPENMTLDTYISPFPRVGSDNNFFRFHSLVKMSFPSFADVELNNRFFMSDKFAAVPAANATVSLINQLNAANNVELADEAVEGNVTKLLLRVTNASRFDAIKMANRYHTDLLFDEAYPALSQKEISR